LWHEGIFPEDVIVRSGELLMPQDFMIFPRKGLGAVEVWASPNRSPHLLPKKAPRLFSLFLFGLLAGFLLLTFVFVFFSAFVSHGVPPFFVRLTVFL
jgi:hypothetical protein